jgi:hypothetical protein
MPNNDYILRGDAVSAFCGNCDGTEVCGQLGEPCEEVKRINAIPAADVEPKQRWIPVTEDVPHIKEGCAGAVVVNAVYWAIGKYISMPLRYVRKKIRNKLVERWEYMDGSIVHKSVLYWMPLPEPPKENPNDK